MPFYQKPCSYNILRGGQWKLIRSEWFHIRTNFLRTCISACLKSPFRIFRLDYRIVHFRHFHPWQGQWLSISARYFLSC